MTAKIRNAGRFGLFCALVAVCPGLARETAREKLEFTLLAGVTFTRTEAVSAYRDIWGQELLTNVFEETVIAPRMGLAPSFRILADYYVRPDIGLQAGAGLSIASVPNASTFNLEYSWKSGTGGNLTGEWPGRGRLRSVPLFLNAVWRRQGDRFGVSASGGPVLFFNAFRAEATAGLGVSDVTYIQTYTPPLWTQTLIQHLDAVAAAIEIPVTRWTALGFNAGLAGTYKIDGRLGAVLDVRFFSCGAKDISWTWVPGTYPGRVEADSRWVVSEDLARYAAGQTSAFHVDPSYFQISAGLKISLR